MPEPRLRLVLLLTQVDLYGQTSAAVAQKNQMRRYFSGTDRLKGHGYGVMVQGAFLLLFDGINDLRRQTQIVNLKTHVAQTDYALQFTFYS